MVMQIVMFTGIITSPKSNTENGNTLIVIYLSSMIFFISGVVMQDIIHQIKRKNFVSNNVINVNYYTTNHRQYNIILFFILLSLILSTWFYTYAGVNVFISALNDFFSSSSNTYRDERMSFFNIPGTGYIYQFRTVILPVLNIFLLLAEPSKKYRRFAKIILPFTVIFLLGTGQRNAFVFVLVFIVIFMYKLHYNSFLKINKKTFILFVSTSFLFLIILTIANNRVSEEENSIFIGAVKSIFERIVSINSTSALSAFNYIQTQQTAWGYDWLMMIADILPGKTDYLSVDRIVYFIAYGNYSGTGPPCIWGSAWFNWSYLGVTVYPFFLGLIYQYIYYYFKRSRSRLYLLFYSFFIVYLGMWTMSSPSFLFNNGIIAMFLLFSLLRYFNSRPLKSSQSLNTK
ncbi:MAG TPA: oligosaccharide repeat unit polymerase [Gallicola sp.]|nr:oligosaccharide repeat unit polymerase [Gallicola sp.]